MEAEWYFNRGDMENAEIAVHKALYKSSEYEQAELMVCAMFLQARISLFKGDNAYVLYTF
jgi:LuxR family maltose regulon positive regulatory protein